MAISYVLPSSMEQVLRGRNGMFLFADVVKFLKPCSCTFLIQSTSVSLKIDLIFLPFETLQSETARVHLCDFQGLQIMKRVEIDGLGCLDRCFSQISDRLSLTKISFEIRTQTFLQRSTTAKNHSICDSTMDLIFVTAIQDCGCDYNG